MVTFGSRMRSVRRQADLTLEELAEKLQTTKATLSRYENNKRYPDINILKEIARVLDVDINYLLGVAEDSDRDHTNTQYEIPEMFDDPGKAREYIDKHRMFGSSGLDTSKLDDEEIVRFANELLEQMKMVSYKYRK